MPFPDHSIPCVVVTGPEPARLILEVCYPNPKPCLICEIKVGESINNLAFVDGHRSRHSTGGIARHVRLSRLASWLGISALKKI